MINSLCKELLPPKVVISERICNKAKWFLTGTIPESAVAQR